MYEYEGSNTVPFDDEITVPDNYSMSDIKYRVNSWLASPPGREYVMEVVSERHVILTKAKHDLKICCYGCVGMILSVFLLLAFMMTLPIYSYEAVLEAMGVYIAVIGVVMVIAVFVFCLKPKKVTYEMRFGNEVPIQIRIRRSGDLEKSIHEYNSLKAAIGGGADPLGGPAPTY